ncbi:MULTISPECIES: site-specific integrase [Bacillaceae]|uniref:Site-specific integrase n=2 Tax=Bacillaceae TaxID=186817 RepID=A0A856M9I3_9BACI|nr:MULTISPECIES: site-specific integrase [Bacillaceae]AMK74816.1 hypothetical protein AWV81_22225 [Bacillus subtilis subsp. natto]API45177.1 hypothetical protein BSR08_22570 [Bacillus subtilis]API98497.1 hypothetical protein BKP58_22110 [Bacillus subtilis]ASB72344.1 putative integrase/recombinase YoeC [Bacillus subtilis subsp. subtilis]AVL07054.1 site-specific integrase [Bacillus subtilis]
MNLVEPIRNRKDIDNMKKLLYSMNERDAVYFIIGINTAFRISDLIHLKFKDVIDEKMKPLDYFELRETKTGKHNKIAMTKGVRKAIVQYVQHRYEGNLDHYLFTGQKSKDKPITRVTAWRNIKAAADTIGLKNIGTHSLRKTFGYHQYKNGTDITLLMDMFNHSSAGITLRYIGITQDQKDQAVKSLDL